MTLRSTLAVVSNRMNCLIPSHYRLIPSVNRGSGAMVQLSPTRSFPWSREARYASLDSKHNPGSELKCVGERSKPVTDPRTSVTNHGRNTRLAVSTNVWKRNLGRDNQDAWLKGPRPDSWFTGIHPRNCPGKRNVTPEYITDPSPHSFCVFEYWTISKLVAFWNVCTL